MRIAIGNDHAAVSEKMRVRELLLEGGHELLDVGVDTTDSVDYPDIAAKVARRVASSEADLGILLCGTGIGVAIAANKLDGIRAAVVHDDVTARMSREHNDANVMCLGARVLDVEQILSCVRIFLSTAFEGGRHENRTKKIHDLEKNRGA